VSATVGLCEPDGTLLMVTTRLDGDGDIPYETLRTLIGGLIDRVIVSDTVDVWVHDEGRYLLPMNVLSRPFYPIGLHGPMVFTTYDDYGGTGPITKPSSCCGRLRPPHLTLRDLQSQARRQGQRGARHRPRLRCQVGLVAHRDIPNPTTRSNRHEETTRRAAGPSPAHPSATQHRSRDEARRVQPRR
jgi:hypothetical protein